MNSVSIFEKSWLDLVFEGKNKSYGAYQLRRENSKTTLTAFFMALLLVATVIAIPLALSRFGAAEQTAPIIEELPPIKVNLTDVKPPNSEPPKQAVAPITKPTEDNSAPLVHPEIVKPSEATPEISKNPTTSIPTNAGGEGIPGKNPTLGTSGTGEGKDPAPENPNPVPTSSLDKLPEFPGGIEKFYNYVGRNFEKPEIDDEKTIRVYVTFVIEKDGAMTDIKVARDPGYGLGKEAIRVLKSLKTKWEPGMMNGQPVRTMYSLPITVKME